jgi:SNF2 family DNA or RNA helicase
MEGSTAHKERTRIVHAFQTDPTVQIFIVSLKTAGVGLNLVAANKVFLMDPWWNPGVEDQAIERVHRIGQKRDVEVVRFVMDKSIEMRMVELNTCKKKLSHKVLSQEGQPVGGESKI